MANLGVDLCDLDLWPLTLTFCMDITSDHGNKSWKFHDDTMMGTWWKRCDRRTDRQTDGRTDGRKDWTSQKAAWSQLKNRSIQSSWKKKISIKYQLAWIWVSNSGFSIIMFTFISRHKFLLYHSEWIFTSLGLQTSGFSWRLLRMITLQQAILSYYFTPASWTLVFDSPKFQSCGSNWAVN